MRVLMLSKACIVGIYQRKLEEMALQNPQLDLRVVVPPSWRDERGDTQLERVFVKGYDLVVSPLRFNGNYHLHYYPQFAAEVAAFKPQIVHIDEEPYNLATWMALRPALKHGAKTLFFSWQNLSRHYPLPFSWMEKKVLRSVDYAIMGTESAAEVWQQKGYTGTWTVIPQFGVDTELFSPASDTVTEARPVHIGFMGRLWIGKGADLLLKALADLLDLEWRLDLIGSGPELGALQAQVQALGLAERVHFTPWLPSTEMPQRMRQLDILVIPSRTRKTWKEQYGRVIVEAMACEVAVIGSDSGAIPDVIGEAGLIFPEDEQAALALQLRRLVEDAHLRETLAKKGRQRVLAHFTQSRIAKQTLDVYEHLIGS